MARINQKRKKPSTPVDSDTDRTEETAPKQRVRWNTQIKDADMSAAEAEEMAMDPDADGDEDESEDESLSTNKSCLASICHRGQIGCAYFNPTRGVISVLEDTQDSRHFDLATMVLEQTNPHIILTSYKSDDKFSDVLRAHSDSNESLFIIRPQKDFTPSKGRARLVGLKLLSELTAPNVSTNASSSSHSGSDGANSTSAPSNAYDFMKRRNAAPVDPAAAQWNASIRMDNFASLGSSPLCMSAIGALIDHLIRLNAVGELEVEESGVEGLDIRGIELMALEKTMHINSDALSSLQIFDPESHGATHSISQTKEGLSLFSTLNNTRSALGRSVLQSWLLRPSTDLKVIKERHDAIACFLRVENLGIGDAMHGHLAGIGNVGRGLWMLKAGRGGMREWQRLVKFSFHCIMLRDSLAELSHGGGVVIVQKLLNLFSNSNFKDLGIMINETIDWEESTNHNRVCVRPHINAQLDEWKHIYHGLDSVLSQIALQISRQIPPDFAESLNVVYFPQLGFLICVPLRDDWEGEDGIVLLDGWTFQFASEAQVYAKSSEMHDLDRHIGDLHPHIVDREIEIIQTLLDKVLPHEASMSTVCEHCAELDVLLSFAEASRTYHYTRPEMTEENVIDIRQGRHPLHEQVVDAFVPNDTYVAGGKSSSAEDDNRRNANILILTGANACGKSVYLKQVALIQFMAQIGCYVPAEMAILGIVDKVFTRVQTRESVSKVQSAFMIDLSQVSLALRNCTSRSLILLDEFGKGTMTADGAGLFAGVLKHLMSRPEGCPKVLTATHFHDLFDDNILAPAPQIAFLHMEILLTTASGDVLEADATESDNSSGKVVVNPGENITYLYRVAEGICLDSHAAKCALMFGVPPRVIERAQYVSELVRNHQIGHLVDEMMTDAEQKELKEAEECCRRFLAWKISDEKAGRNFEGVRQKLNQVLGSALELEKVE